MKRMIRSSTTIQAATKDVLLTSDDGLFELVRTSGVDSHGDPWEDLSVKSYGDAEEYIVQVRLNKWSNWDRYTTEVAHGMRMKADSWEDTARYIEVLQSALKFAKELEASEYLKKR